MLQLEVGITRELTIVQGDAIVLTNVTVAPYPRGVLCHQTFLAMFLGDDIDNACDGITTIEGTRGSLHNLNLFDVMRINQSEVVLTTIVAIEPMTIDEDQHIGIAQAVHLQVRAHIVLAEIEAGSKA